MFFSVTDKEIMAESNPHDKARLVAMKRNYDFMVAMFEPSNAADSAGASKSEAADATEESKSEAADWAAASDSEAADSTGASDSEAADWTATSDSEAADSTGASDSEAADAIEESDSDLDESSCQSDGGDDYVYEPVMSFADTVALPSSSSHEMDELRTPKEDYWEYINRTFIDSEDEQRYIVDSVVRATGDIYMFKYVAIDSAGNRVYDAEENYSTCHEMVTDNSWAHWAAFKKKKVWYRADTKKV